MTACKTPRELYLYEGRRVMSWGDAPLHTGIWRALIIEVRVYRLTGGWWRFIGGPDSINITTDAPQALTWRDLWPSSETHCKEQNGNE